MVLIIQVRWDWMSANMLASAIPISPVITKLVVHRARRVQRFLSQPFHVAEAFTGLKGEFVSIEDTIKGFNMIMDGEVDKYPEAAFNLVGTIEQAIAKGEKLIADAKK